MSLKDSCGGGDDDDDDDEVDVEQSILNVCRYHFSRYRAVSLLLYNLLCDGKKCIFTKKRAT